MKKCHTISRILFLILFLLPAAMHSAPSVVLPIPSVPSVRDSLTHQKRVDITFSGIAKSESGDAYGYYFQMSRQKEIILSHAVLIRLADKKIILNEEKQEKLLFSESDDWHVGGMFLRFSPITASWIFGIRLHDKRGFNFKVDMINQDNVQKNVQTLRKGLVFSIIQATNLNGHIRDEVGGKEQFVSAHQAWFRQIWATQKHEGSHYLNGLLCRFQDGSGFYALTLKEKDALQASIAGWRDGSGDAKTLSQFVNFLPTDDKKWTIKLFYPNKAFILERLLDIPKSNEANNLLTPLVIGVNEVAPKGFCIANEALFAEESKITTAFV